MMYVFSVGWALFGYLIIRFLMKMVLLGIYELKQVIYNKLLILMIPHGRSKFAIKLSLITVDLDIFDVGILSAL